jgi:hypothetical protein
MIMAQYNIKVREPPCSGFRLFIKLSDESGWDHMASESAFPNLLLSLGTLSVQSFHLICLFAFVLYGTSLSFNQLLYLCFHENKLSCSLSPSVLCCGVFGNFSPNHSQNQTVTVYARIRSTIEMFTTVHSPTPRRSLLSLQQKQYLCGSMTIHLNTSTK